MPNQKNSIIKTPLSETEYHTQLEKLYPRCPFPRVLFILANRELKIGDLVKRANGLGYRDIDAFQIVDLLKGRVELTHNGKPTRLLTAFGKVIGRSSEELIELAAAQSLNYYETKRIGPLPNGGALSSGQELRAIQSHLEGIDYEGSLCGEDISRQMQRAQWNIAGYHVMYRGAKHPRAYVRKNRQDILSSLDKK